MLDFIIFYFVLGVVINWIVSLYALLTDEEGAIEIDAMGFILTTAVWPVTVYNIINSFFSKE